LNFVPSLADLCLHTVCQHSLTLETALDLYDWADQQQAEELKINLLKYLSLNLVSFLDGGAMLDRLLALPVYLLRDLENFVKIHDSPEKYLAYDMQAVEDIEGAACLHNENGDGPFIGGKDETSLTSERCEAMYVELAERF
jgi:hypothetical protein